MPTEVTRGLRPSVAHLISHYLSITSRRRETAERFRGNFRPVDLPDERVASRHHPLKVRHQQGLHRPESLDVENGRAVGKNHDSLKPEAAFAGLLTSSVSFFIVRPSCRRDYRFSCQ